MRCEEDYKEVLKSMEITQWNLTKDHELVAFINVNSVKNQLTVEGITVLSIELFNSLGQKVRTSNKNEINTSDLHGLYIVNVKESGRTAKTMKILIN